SITQNRPVEARQYISTSYGVILIIGLGLLSISLVLIPFINWQSIFNTLALTNSNLKLLMVIFLSTLILSFVLGLINPILNAMQLSAFTNLGSILTSLVFAFLLLVFSE